MVLAKENYIYSTIQFCKHISFIVQAIKALGKEKYNAQVRYTIKNYFSDDELQSILSETQYITAWIYEIIKDIAKNNKEQAVINLKRFCKRYVRFYQTVTHYGMIEIYHTSIRHRGKKNFWITPHEKSAFPAPYP